VRQEFLDNEASESSGDQSMKVETPTWVPIMLRLAGIYNLLWGLWVVLDPVGSLQVCGYPQQIPYPQLWQCLGMIVGVYGIGYWMAASNPVRHWLIVLIGLLGKVLGPLGFMIYYAQGTLPLSAGKLCIFNDLIWWLPFTGVLWTVLRAEAAATEQPDRTFDDVLRNIPGNTGQTLMKLSTGQPLLVVFLRHAGCSFCREALADISQVRTQIEEGGTRIALIHMSSDARAREFFNTYSLADLPRFSDPEQVLYRAFDLKNGTFSQLLGPRVFFAGFQAAILRRHGFGRIEGNGLRMPGVFLLRDGKILVANRLHTAAERPDYQQFACPADPQHSAPLPS